MAVLPEFNIDPFPEKTKVLFIGFSESSHTHSWIGLLENAEINVRLFALPTGKPPDSWRVKTYLTTYVGEVLDSEIRATQDYSRSAHQWLASIIREWRPHIIHTLGLEPAGYFYFEVREAFHLEGIGKWLLQLRGGSDLALKEFNLDVAPRIAQVLKAADQILGDNPQNYEIAASMGVGKERISSLGTVPGAGGIDIDTLQQRWQGSTSLRRAILFPKAYNSPWSTAFPVLEALKICWESIQPCEVHMLAMTSEVMMWYRALPAEIKRFCHVYAHIPREQLFDIIISSRVLLAPSLIDGTPNTMFEAMAAGAFPIVSPLDTIASMVKSRQNVLFARNLYPNEIADALVEAMTNDNLVDQAAQSNIHLVREVADRAKIRPRVVNYYIQLAKGVSPRASNVLKLEPAGFVFSPWNTLMPEGQNQAGLLIEYRTLHTQIIELQYRFDALQQAYLSSQKQLAQWTQDYATLQQECVTLKNRLMKLQKRHDNSQ